MSACPHEWIRLYGFGCLPGSLRAHEHCALCGASRPAPDVDSLVIVRSNTSSPTRLPDGTFA